jgi:hypothetical protein
MSKTIRLLIFSLTRWAFFVCSFPSPRLFHCTRFGIFSFKKEKLLCSYCAIWFSLQFIVGPGKEQKSWIQLHEWHSQLFGGRSFWVHFWVSFKFLGFCLLVFRFCIFFFCVYSRCENSWGDHIYQALCLIIWKLFRNLRNKFMRSNFRKWIWCRKF